MYTNGVTMTYGGKRINVEGFYISKIDGRETLNQEQLSEKIPLINGEHAYGERLEARTITVTFEPIFANTMAKRIDILNALRPLMVEKESQWLIFSDEPDKFFKAYVQSVTNTQIVFYCPDPLKYSTTTKTFTATDEGGHKHLYIRNMGTAPVHVDYTIHIPSEIGYIGIVSNRGVMEFGKKDEQDEQDTTGEEVINIEDFVNAPHSTHDIDWLHPTYGTKGTLRYERIIQNTPGIAFDKWYITLDQAGVKESATGANGGLKTLMLPHPTQNLYCYMHLMLYCDTMGQTGEMSLCFLTEDNKMVAGLNWYKLDASGNTACYEVSTYDPYGDAKILKKWSYQANHEQDKNPFYGTWGHCDFRKEGAKLTYYYYGNYYDFYVPEVATDKIAKVQLSIRQWQDRSREKNQLNKWMGFDTINIRADDTIHENIKNRFQAGEVFIDGSAGEIYHNGMPKMEEEVIGTQYFTVPQGDTEVEFYFSEWASSKPTVSAEIREAWY